MLLSRISGAGEVTEAIMASAFVGEVAITGEAAEITSKIFTGMPAEVRVEVNIRILGV